MIAADPAPRDAPVVTVVTPTKDRPRLLASALASIAAQDVPAAVEVVVVDDGSKPDLAGDVADVVTAAGARLIRHESSRGVSAARNSGIAAATGRYVAFLDDDDLWSPTKLRSQLAALDAAPDSRWSATAGVHIDTDLQVTGSLAMPAYAGSLRDLLLAANWIPAGGSSVLVETATLRAAGGFVEGVHGCEDWDMWVRLAELSSLAYVDEPLVAYRSWGGNSSDDLSVMQQGREWVLSRHGPPAPTELPSEVMGDVDWHQHLGRMNALQGRRRSSATEYVRAWRAGGGVGQLVYAAAAGVSPAVVIRRLARVDGRMDPDWRERAEAWLAPLRAR